jgi:hypothetical protein
MRNPSSSTERQIEQATLIFAIFFLLSFPAYAQVAEKRLLLISLPDHQLALIEDGQVKKVYSVAVGKETTPSPTGTFHIVARLVDPTYYHEGTVIAPGPRNPLGNRWMGLDRKGYGIHGTNAPQSIGKSASHGCIRLAKRDLEELFAAVKVGDAVEIRGERDAQTAAVFGGGTPAETTVAAQAVETEATGQ